MRNIGQSARMANIPIAPAGPILHIRYKQRLNKQIGYQIVLKNDCEKIIDERIKSMFMKK